MLNSQKTRLKNSKVEIKTNTMINCIFITQVILNIFSALYSMEWEKNNSKTDYYLEYETDEDY